MNIRSIAYRLSKHPALKKKLKNIYQYLGNVLSDKKSKAHNLEKISIDETEYLFGYYDKTPWNYDETFMIYLKVEDADKETAPFKEANIVLMNLKTKHEKILATTSAWNVQQGCMLQWLGPDFDSKIIYNDFFNDRYVSIILDIHTLEKKVINSPVYSVSLNGDIALTLNFPRLHRLRPGYGYSNGIGQYQDTQNGFCIWKIDIKKNETIGILKYEDLIQFDPKESMINADHKVNHIMINPSGNRFMFLHRWIKNGIKRTRLLTCNIDGTDLFNLLDEDMVSHCTWKDDNTIFCWAHTYEYGNSYYYLIDKTDKINVLKNDNLISDGHPSFTKDGNYFVTDTYPDFHRKQHIFIYSIKNSKAIEVAAVYSNIKYLNDCRCDLHPRWSPSGDKICFDGALDKNRQVYVINVEDLL
ncbi:hypothetical protein MKC66_19735 [[Clostridium] innocuum]|nr:hypothetical protein [[Clostridium] innocuum]